MQMGTAPGLSGHINRPAGRFGYAERQKNKRLEGGMTEMLVTVTGFGSVWRRRFGKTRAIRGGLRAQRTSTQPAFKSMGKVQDPAQDCRSCPVQTVSEGFDPELPAPDDQTSVFECAEPCIWQDRIKILFKRMLPAPAAA